MVVGDDLAQQAAGKEGHVGQDETSPRIPNG